MCGFVFQNHVSSYWIYPCAKLIKSTSYPGSLLVPVTNSFLFPGCGVSF